MKKQSAGSRKQQQQLPEDFVLYLDENLHNCRPILDALVQHGIKHERHGQHFQPGVEDTIWLPYIGERGWILITKDKRIRFNELEKIAVRRNHVREFYFTSGNYSGIEMAQILIGALPQIKKMLIKHGPPFIASISKSGQVMLRFPSE